jgi:glycosyltransferase involved in cell wall biosynthesis
MRKQKTNITIVIPAHNEGQSLPKLLPKLVDTGYKVIVVDNASTDDTYDVAKKYCKVIRIKKMRGKGYVLRTGFKEAKSDIIVMMDADLSHRPCEIPKLIQPLLNDKKIGLVVGSRTLGGSEEYTPSKTVGNIIITKTFNLFFGTNLTDTINGFKAFRRVIASGLRAEGFNIEIELLGNCIRKGFGICEVPSYELARRTGKSKLNKILDGFLLLNQVFIEAYKTKL